MNHLNPFKTSLCLLLAAGCTHQAIAINTAQLSPNAEVSTPTISARLIAFKPNNEEIVASEVSSSSSADSPTEGPSPLLAQQDPCANAQNQRQINQCSQQKAEAADKKLNQAYQQVIAQLNGQQRQALINAQSAWIKFRDTTCAYEKGRFAGGSIAPSIYSTCIERVTAQRTTDLENYMKEGWPVQQ